MDMSTAWVWIAIVIGLAFIGLIVEMDDAQWRRNRE